MSRRASLLLKEEQEQPEGSSKNKTARVRFPDELVFLDNIKENDVQAMDRMLRRASLKMDINSMSSSGMTALHQAVVDGNFQAVRLLIRHGADVNKTDEGWMGFPFHG
ncbi:DgyrCDS7309 [Dimorphilus gyrociliatus]|uniref:DgyrCDS7309 n=1 Tax=Dimorphilus gyrociliatus TaxID=2664684 RepID=A0A7I8VQQ4_9ANNE|nr:DgyrCDS7309 [Dimorphilus gyrociliatus]